MSGEAKARGKGKKGGYRGKKGSHTEEDEVSFMEFCSMVWHWLAVAYHGYDF